MIVAETVWTVGSGGGGVASKKNVSMLSVVKESNSEVKESNSEVKESNFR